MARARNEAVESTSTPQPKEAVYIGSCKSLKKRTVTSENELTVEGHKINLINIERELWPGITKADLIRYYLSIAEYILPQLRERPVGLNICLNSPAKGGFFLRGMQGHAPSWAQIFLTDRKHKKKGKSDKIEWLVIKDKAMLLWAVNHDSIDIHPWSSRTSSPLNPDYIAVDLDPSDDDFKKVIETALAAKELFDKHGLKSFIKTSGKTGMHLLIPCTDIKTAEAPIKGQKAETGQARRSVETICNEIHELVPNITTTTVSKSSRGDLLYVDPNQNDYADRLACVYCPRDHYVPTVSTPLEWKEVKPALDPGDFTIKTINERLKKKGDLLENLLNHKLRSSNANFLKTLL
ncbi:MAG: hypothetical protein ABJA71_06440 [Ginsengibacter sp.]